LQNLGCLRTALRRVCEFLAITVGYDHTSDSCRLHHDNGSDLVHTIDVIATT
jgi:hypothetical protein